MKNQQNLIICILGMHRSGTSCLAGSLQAAGLPGGEVVKYANDNLKGNRENLLIMQLNDQVLAHNDGRWDNPPTTMNYTTQHQQKRDKLIQELNSQFPVWMFKDPRTALTFPFWQEGIPNLQLIGTFRYPLKVAMSLYQRQAISIPLREGIKLWIHYNNLILKAFIQNNQVEEAIINGQQALELHPQNSQIYFVLGKAYAQQQDWEQAISLYQQAIELDDQLSAIIYVHLGNALNQQGNKSAALASYQKAINSQPESVHGYIGLGNYYRQEQKWEQAILNYEQAIKLNSQNPGVYFALGEVFRKQEDLEKTIKKQSISIIPTFSECIKLWEIL
jgi:tetratricopeptide (TPR) repeat protein